MNYKESFLWKNSLGNINYFEDDLCYKLCSAYEHARENASCLLKKIGEDFPDLTIHDITHIDNLWHVASVITGPNYIVNPLEGFVLGCAFLVHDAVLSYDAIGGVDKLRNTTEWKDFYADYESSDDLEQIYKECDFKTIRLLHANKAESIFSQEFNDNGRSFYIIDDYSLRKHLGEIIGKIAASHHWSIDDVEKLDNQYGSPAGFPITWNINPIKLACILRCADAGHIDGNRAPDDLFKSLAINSDSKYHWIAQNKLSQIMIDNEDKERILIKSNQSFDESESAAWYIAYDLVMVLNNELRQSNDLLRKSCTPMFQAKCVRGAGSQEELSKFIKTNKWKPCDASVHISNVESLIKSLGGEKLYGKENKVEIVLRELIQNARDAIVARRKREDNFEGRISVSIYKDSLDSIWVEVKDDGIGMSINTIKECLLNFGVSFWKSDLIKCEFPGLNSSGYKSIGEFGIGFYSVFMIAKEVIVETRRYDRSKDSAIQLKFKNGFCLRPVITCVNSSSMDYSTIVKFSLDDNLEQWHSEKTIKVNVNKEKPFNVPYKVVISNLVAGLDVNVFYSELNDEYRLVHKDISLLEEKSLDVSQWLKDISYSDYRETDLYSNYIDKNYKRVEKVYIDGRFCGMIALNTLWKVNPNFLGVETVGGLTTFNRPHDVGGYIGCFIAKPETARRNAISSESGLRDWAINQLKILLDDKDTNYLDLLFLPYAASKYKIDISNYTYIIYCRSAKEIREIIRLEDLITNLTNKDETLVFIMSSISERYRVSNLIDSGRYFSNVKDNEWLFIPVENSSFLELEENNSLEYTILDYINIIANKLGITIIKEIEENRIIDILGTPCDVMKLSFRKNDMSNIC